MKPIKFKDTLYSSKVSHIHDDGLFFLIEEFDQYPGPFSCSPICANSIDELYDKFFSHKGYTSNSHPILIKIYNSNVDQYRPFEILRQDSRYNTEDEYIHFKSAIECKDVLSKYANKRCLYMAPGLKEVYMESFCVGGTMSIASSCLFDYSLLYSRKDYSMFVGNVIKSRFTKDFERGKYVDDNLYIGGNNFYIRNPRYKFYNTRGIDVYLSDEFSTEVFAAYRAETFDSNINNQDFTYLYGEYEFSIPVSTMKLVKHKDQEEFMKTYTKICCIND